MKIKSITSFDFTESRPEGLQSFILVYVILNITRVTLSNFIFFLLSKTEQFYRKPCLLYCVSRAIYDPWVVCYATNINKYIFAQFTIAMSGHRAKYTECETRL